VGGNSQHTVEMNISELAKKEQVVIGVRKGTREELLHLIQLVSTGMVGVHLLSYDSHHFKPVI